MLSEKAAIRVITIILPVFIALFSIFICAEKVPDIPFMSDSVENLDDARDTVMAFSAVTLLTSVAITILPDDYATPIADSLADMNQYFILILAAIMLEKILVVEGVSIAFSWIIPIACALYTLGAIFKRPYFKILGRKIAILALAIILVVPCATHLSEYICASQLEYVEDTINEAENGSETINKIMQDTNEEESVFDRISDAFKTAISGISDMVEYFKNVVKKCVNSVAILVVTSCIIPIIVMLLFVWLLKQLFNIQPMFIPGHLPHRHKDNDNTQEAKS